MIISLEIPFDDVFVCNETITNFCDYQTLITGICAVVAAFIAAMAVAYQSISASKSYLKELEISRV